MSLAPKGCKLTPLILTKCKSVQRNMAGGPTSQNRGRTQLYQTCAFFVRQRKVYYERKCVPFLSNASYPTPTHVFLLSHLLFPCCLCLLPESPDHHRCRPHPHHCPIHFFILLSYSLQVPQAMANNFYYVLDIVKVSRSGTYTLKCLLEMFIAS